MHPNLQTDFPGWKRMPVAPSAFSLHLYTFLQINPNEYHAPSQDVLADRHDQYNTGNWLGHLLNLSEPQFPRLQMRDVDQMISKILSVIQVMPERLMC